MERAPSIYQELKFLQKVKFLDRPFYHVTAAKGQVRITAILYAYRMHEIRCHEYIISFYIAIFNRLPSYKKVSNRFNLSLNGKGYILGLKMAKIVYY